MSNRTTLKNYFVTNAVPKQSDFSDLIDSGLNQNDDSIRKQGNDPISLQAQPAVNDIQDVLQFYKSFNDANAAWKFSVVNKGSVNASGGLNISNPAAASSIFIRDADGNVGIGTANPSAKLHIKGNTVIESGYLGIGTSPGFPLSFPNVGGDKISLFGQSGGHYGFGIGNSTLQIHTDMVDSDIVFGYGSSIAFNETMRVKGNGNIGMGNNNPRCKMDVGVLTKGQLGSVLARLSEGNYNGDGTFLGVRGYVTQIDDTNPAGNVKSFSIEHSFYGQTNSAVNFFRGGSSLGGFLSFSTNNNTERLRIDPYGNIGIGTGSPYALLDVKGNIYTTIHGSDSLHDVSNRGTTRIGMQTGNSGDGFAGIELETKQVTYTGNNTNGNGGVIKFMTWGYYINTTKEIMRIDESGRVGIGTATPTAKLEVSGYVGATLPAYGYLNGAGAVGRSGGGFFASIKASNRIMAEEFDATSDGRIKKDFLSLNTQQSLETINQVQIKSFFYKDDVQHDSNLHTGVIAQELEEVFPQSVSVHSDFVPDIYSLPASAYIDNAVLNVTMPAPHNLQTGDTVRFFTAAGAKENMVTKTDDTSFSVDNWQEEGTGVFVYGKKVDDYRTVNYNSIFCLGISAIQELHKQLQQLKGEVITLKEKLASAFVPAL